MHPYILNYIPFLPSLFAKCMAGAIWYNSIDVSVTLLVYTD